MKLKTWLRRKLALRRRLRNPNDVSAGYYQGLHERSDGYQETNWLLPELDRLLQCKPKSLTEIGYGNGQFLRAVAPHVESVVGLDWARSPEALHLPENVSLLVGDATKDHIPKSDLICSADVLEHFHPKDIHSVIEKLHRAGRNNFHVIACYDDGHSHLSINSPETWLAIFRASSHDYNLIRVWERKRKHSAKVCLIANY